MCTLCPLRASAPQAQQQLQSKLLEHGEFLQKLLRKSSDSSSAEAASSKHASPAASGLPAAIGMAAAQTHASAPAIPAAPEPHGRSGSHAPADASQKGGKKAHSAPGRRPKPAAKRAKAPYLVLAPTGQLCSEEELKLAALGPLSPKSSEAAGSSFTRLEQPAVLAGLGLSPPQRQLMQLQLGSPQVPQLNGGAAPPGAAIAAPAALAAPFLPGAGSTGEQEALLPQPQQQAADAEALGSFRIDTMQVLDRLSAGLPVHQLELDALLADPALAASAAQVKPSIDSLHACLLCRRCRAHPGVFVL